MLIYETGLTWVPDLSALQWVNGALADHLTSYGGVLDGSAGQMTVLDWIASGATASVGTVSEPCALVQKFPHPQVLLLNYLQARLRSRRIGKALPGRSKVCSWVSRWRRRLRVGESALLAHDARWLRGHGRSNARTATKPLRTAPSRVAG